jgi:hypothetical protein
MRRPLAPAQANFTADGPWSAEHVLRSFPLCFEKRRGGGIAFPDYLETALLLLFAFFFDLLDFFVFC